jgi:sensor domain CHASE-containing protein
MMIAARPILPSNGKGEVLGTLLLGRYLSPDLTDELSRQNQLEIKVWPLDDPNMPSAERELIRA